MLVFVCSLLQIFLTKYDISVVPKDHSESYRSPYVVQDAAEMGIELVPNRNEFMSYYIVNHTDVLIGENLKFAMTVNGMNSVEIRGFYRLK